MNNLHLRDGKIAFRWKRWRNKKRQEVSYCLMVLFSGAVLFGAGGMALAGPTGGQVTGGTGTINQTGTTTTIDQTSNVLNINWQTFSTAPNETVNFVQPGSTSIAINRVIGGVPSYLQGALNANGRVFILNSAGITFAGTSRVNVGALLATTAMSIDGNVGGLANYSAPSGSGGSVINQGSITVSNGGFAILAAPYVQNTGFIKADLGTVALAGTNSFTLDLRGDGLINFVVPPGTAAQIVADGQKVGVDNSGTLQARSGQVIISANVATQVVNAVVNMSGVVDADALSGNSSGGSVLVTSTGDINLGGTITAQGNGTGAGGQIVTKAAGLDNVESGANLLAAGGAEGKGGHIEVSGHNVKLDGNIDPGKGGSLFVDPKNLIVSTAGSHSSNANAVVGNAHVNEHWVSNELQGDVNVTLAASNNIIFKGTGTSKDFILYGGDGNLTVTAKENIEFSNVKNYEIRTGGGDVTLTANNGNIGSSDHRVNIVSGWGTDIAVNPVAAAFHYANVTQAGDIILKAGNDIFLNSITIRSVAGGSKGDRDARFQARAHTSINIAGALDVEASATGDVMASATALLLAPKIIVTGPATVTANAHGTGSGNDTAFAVLTAAGTVAGSLANTEWIGGEEVHFDNAVDVEAFANGHGANAINDAAIVLLAAESVTVDGNATVKATATGSDVVGVIRAHAHLSVVRNVHSTTASSHFTENGAELIDFGSAIDVTANVQGNDANSLDAKAGVDFNANSITVDGPVVVDAFANGDEVNNVNAHAKLVADFSFSSRGSSTNGINHVRSAAHSITFGSAIDVEAKANGSDPGQVLANAEVVLAADSIAVAGPATVKATASGSHEHSFVANAVLIAGRCSAELASSTNYNCHFGADTVHFANAVDVEAKANGFAINSAVAALASAQLYANHIQVQGPATVKATADNSGNAPRLVGATAKLTAAGGAISGSSSSEHNRTLNAASDDVIFNQAIDVEAHASGSLLKTGGNAIALADVRLAADGEIYIGGNVGVIASATGHGSNRTHFASKVIATADFTAGGRENSHQGSFSHSFNQAGAGTVFLDPAFTVTANANGHFVHNIAANAQGVLAADSITVDGPVSVTALANGYSADNIKANAILIAEGHFASNSACCTNSSYSRNAADSITFGNTLDVEAKASGNNVKNDIEATASAQLYAAKIQVNGSATVKATASNSGGKAHIVSAKAKLTAAGSASSKHSSSGSVSNNRLVGGSSNISFAQAIDVEAHANGAALGAGGAASALADVKLAAEDEIYVGGNVTVDASATGHGTASNKFAGRVNAQAGFTAEGSNGHHASSSESSFNRDGASTIFLDPALTVTAKASGHFVNDITANAQAVLAADSVRVDGVVAITASANGFSANGIRAEAALFVDDGSSFNSSSSERNFHRFGASYINFLRSVDVQAKASGNHIVSNIEAGASALLAAESILMQGNIVVTASVNGFNAERMAAHANLIAEGHSSTNASSGSESNRHRNAASSINFLGTVDVQAMANGSNVSREIEATASAQFYGNFITVAGEATVKATANHGGSHSVDSAISRAKLVAAEGVDSYFDSSTANVHTIPAATILFQNGIDVEALTNGRYIDSTASANAFAHLAAFDVTVNGDTKVLANATGHGSTYNLASNVAAFAVFLADGGSYAHYDLGQFSYRTNVSPADSVTLGGNLDVEAKASGHSVVGVVDALAVADLLANDSITIDGPVTIKAKAFGNVHVSFSNGHSVDGSAHFSATAHNVTINHNVDVQATASASNRFEYVDAIAEASMEAEQLGNGALTVGGNVTVLASAHGSSGILGSGEDFARAKLDADGLTMAFQQGIDIEARATGEHINEIHAEATADLGDASYFGSFTVTGPVKVHAQAQGTSIAGSVLADAQLWGSASSMTFKNGFNVTAFAHGHDVNNIEALAEGTFDGAELTVSRPIVVSASASGTYVGHNMVANAELFASVDGMHASGIDVQAKANGSYVGDEVVASALAELFVDTITVSGLTNVHATASDTGDPFAVYANAQLIVAAHLSGSLFDTHRLFGASSITLAGVDVAAKARGEFATYVSADAGVHLAAEGVSVGGVTVDALAQGFEVEFVEASALFVADDGSSGTCRSPDRFFADVVRTGGLNITGQASGSGVGEVKALALGDILADDVFVGGGVNLAALARGNGVGSVDGNAEFDVSAGSIFIQGPINALARADVSNTYDGFGAEAAFAEAKVDLDARFNLSVVPSGTNHVNGITVQAFADTQHLAFHAWAGAFIDATAASDGGTGNLYVHGNILAQAVAFGTDTGNTALAFQHLRGSNVTVVGNILSLANADATRNDHALAGVSMDADQHDTSESHHGVILIIGDAPIASANAGTAHARRQAAYSTQYSSSGPNHNFFAFADIDIEGSEAVVVTPTVDQQLALLTLETLVPNPPWASSSLSEILLSIDHHDCGVLGGAGNPNGKPADCEKGPFDISETDTLP